MTINAEFLHLVYHILQIRAAERQRVTIILCLGNGYQPTEVAPSSFFASVFLPPEPPLRACKIHLLPFREHEAGRGWVEDPFALGRSCENDVSAEHQVPASSS